MGGQNLGITLGFGRLQGYSDMGRLYLCHIAVL